MTVGALAALSIVMLNGENDGWLWVARARAEVGFGFDDEAPDKTRTAIDVLIVLNAVIALLYFLTY